jgi:hypothetical protein
VKICGRTVQSSRVGALAGCLLAGTLVLQRIL